MSYCYWLLILLVFAMSLIVSCPMWQGILMGIAFGIAFELGRLHQREISSRK